MKIAIQGCAHGELDNIYASIQHLEERENIKIDLLICCGDFQAIRNEDDLDCMHCPPKYRTMNTFWKYYSGEETVPVPTIFVGGNHEASNYLWELYYGGFVAPRIYFMGFAGVIWFGNIRIGGLSGIFSARDYYSGHYERAPYNSSDIISVYHVRHYDVHKVLQIKDPINIFISHDWPQGITNFGNSEKLVRHKPHFETEVRNHSLGSRAAEEILKKLKPSYWFSAHLHTKFTAVVQHGEGGPITKFLALDKCLPGRNFLQIIDIESDEGPYEFQYDEEWLAITRAYNSYFPLDRKTTQMMPEMLQEGEHREWVRKRLAESGLKPFDFKITVPPYHSSQSRGRNMPVHVRNPQTEELVKLLDLPYLLDSTEDVSTPSRNLLSFRMNYNDPNELFLDDSDTDCAFNDDDTEDSSQQKVNDPNEILLEDDT
eukprot:TRINITY_DN11527_c0_g2_i2.p1 TRINITY_DN11527_c0_g2~~TRINITY_DN11527_c0_g2_i2.p1  ORF type:complete len:429 (+),score=79.52 TRINITY_DN11527_c0_g2_i2:151-1437(+)